MPARTWPSSEGKKATITRAMPVPSTSWPSSTNSGTASRMRPLMPSSIRPTTMVSGVDVIVSKYADVASANANAIGTPAMTAAPSRPTKNTTSDQLPIADQSGSQSVE